MHENTTRKHRKASKSAEITEKILKVWQKQQQKPDKKVAKKQPKIIK